MYIEEFENSKKSDSGDIPGMHIEESSASEKSDGHIEDMYDEKSGLFEESYDSDIEEFDASSMSVGRIWTIWAQNIIKISNIHTKI